MANASAELLTTNLRHPNGNPVECVISNTTIVDVAEAADCAEKYARAGVGLCITVTSCWCYGSETMDMNPFIPKAVWGFNGGERPGAVSLAAVLAADNHKGLPAFSIYGRDVQDNSDMTIPEDVHNHLDQRTHPTSPTHWFGPNITGRDAFSDVYSVMAKWGANHCALSYGHIGSDMICLASMLRITVSMYNNLRRKNFSPQHLEPIWRHGSSRS